MKRHWSEDLPPDVCGEAVDWCKTQPSLKVAWEKSEDGVWMIWLLGRQAKNSEKKLRLLAADIAESVFDLVHDKYKLSAAWAISAARRGNKEECDAAAYAAYIAANAATYTADAAYIAADAAYIAAAAAYAASYVPYSAYATADAAYAADAGSTHKKIVADFVREHFPNPPEIKRR